MKDYLKIEPERLVSEITKPRLWICLIIAFFSVIILLGVFSIPFIGECIEYETIHPVQVKRNIEKAEKEAKEAEAKKKKEAEEKAAARKKAEEDAAKQKQAAEEKAKTAQNLMDDKNKKPANASRQNAPAPQTQPQGQAAAPQAEGDVALPAGPAVMDFETL